MPSKTRTVSINLSRYLRTVNMYVFRLSDTVQKTVKERCNLSMKLIGLFGGGVMILSCC